MNTLRDLSVSGGQMIIDDMLDGQNPVYESPVLPGPDDDAWVNHSLPDWVVANVITLTLVGKNRRQFDDAVDDGVHDNAFRSGYYACVEGVFVRGIQLHHEEEEEEEPSLPAIQLISMLF